MTNEQWIIYLYGIWPNGGFQLTYVLLSITWAAWLLGIFLSQASDKNSGYYNPNEYIWNMLSIKAKFLPLTVGITLSLLCNLVPGKNAFLALAATPSLVESLESETGKLHKLNKLMNLGIDKAIKELETK